MGHDDRKQYNYVAREVIARTGKDTRVVVLGHLQRGGQPTPYDRILATRFGAAAVRELAAGRYGEVVVLRGGIITTIPMLECAGKVKTVPTDDEMIRTARGLGITFGDEDVSEQLPDALEALEARPARLNGDGALDA